MHHLFTERYKVSMKGQNQGLLFWVLSLLFAYAHHPSYSKFFPVALCFSEELIFPPDLKVSDGKSNHPYSCCGESAAYR